MPILTLKGVTEKDLEALVVIGELFIMNDDALFMMQLHDAIQQLKEMNTVSKNMFYLQELKKVIDLNIYFASNNMTDILAAEESIKQKCYGLFSRNQAKPERLSDQDIASYRQNIELYLKFMSISERIRKMHKKCINDSYKP